MESLNRRKLKVKTTKAKVNKSQTGLEFIRSHPKFKALSKKEAKDFLSCFQVHNLKSSDLIFKQGDHANSLYILTQGRLELNVGSLARSSSFKVYTNASTIDEQSAASVEMDDWLGLDTLTQVVRFISQGEIFGQRALTHGSHYRKYSCKVSSCTATFLQLTREKYNQAMNRKSFILLRSLIDEETKRVAREAVESIPMFKSFSAPKLKDNSEALDFKAVDEHCVLCEKGDSIDILHILISGEIVVANKDENDVINECRRITPFMEFGGFVDEDEPLNGTMITLKKCTYLLLQNEKADEFFLQNPLLMEKLTREKERRRGTKRAIESMQLFRGISQAKKEALTFILKGAQFQPGSVIKEEKTTSDRKFYIIVGGEAEILLNKKKIRTLTKNDYFGECSLLTSQSSSSSTSIKTSSKGLCKCLLMEENKFSELIKNEKSIEAELELKMTGVKCGLEAFINHIQGKTLFKRFLYKEKADRNLDFLNAVNDLERANYHRTQKLVVKAFGLNVHELKSKKRNILKSKAEKIYVDFIQEGKINISSAIENELHEKFERGNYGFHTVFNKAKAALITMLEYDKFDRFKKSEEFLQLMEEVKPYE